jgi:hypothetical protein
MLRRRRNPGAMTSRPAKPRRRENAEALVLVIGGGVWIFRRDRGFRLADSEGTGPTGATR